MDQDNAKCGWFEASSSYDIDIVPLTDIVDMYRDAGIRANAMLLHQRDQLTLCQVVWRTRLTLIQLDLQYTHCAYSS